MSPTLYSSRVSPHPYHGEEAVEGWAWDVPGQDHLTESWEEEKGKLGGAEGILARRVRT